MSVAVAARESSTRNPEGRTQSGAFADVRAGVGTPKSLVQKLAARFGRDPSHVALIVALSRAIGLWEPIGDEHLGAAGQRHAAGAHAPALRHVAPRRRVGRGAHRARGAPPRARVARLEPRRASCARWSSRRSRSSARGAGCPGLRSPDGSGAITACRGSRACFAGGRERVGAEPVDPVEVARRIVHESLPALGIVDLGEDEDLPHDPAVDGDGAPVALRLTARGRALLADKTPQGDGEPSKFLDTHVLRARHAGPRRAPSSRSRPSSRVGRAAETLDLIVAPQTLARALSAGLEADVLRARIEAIAPLPEALVAHARAGERRRRPRDLDPGRSGLLWVEDANVREMLRTRRATQELFIDPSPPAGCSCWRASISIGSRAGAAPSASRSSSTARSCARARSRPPSSKSVPPPRLTPGRGTPKA